MRFCPLTQKECRNDCQLYANGNCAIYIIADRQHRINNEINDIASSQKNIANDIRQINQKTR